jgi:hypothetical protein
VKPISRKKVVWGIGKLLPHIKQLIATSRFIPTDEKDSLFKKFEESYKVLDDAIRREYGEIPITPEEQKRRKKGLEPLKELKLVDELIYSILLKE